MSNSNRSNHKRTGLKLHRSSKSPQRRRRPPSTLGLPSPEPLKLNPEQSAPISKSSQNRMSNKPYPAIRSKTISGIPQTPPATTHSSHSSSTHQAAIDNICQVNPMRCNHNKTWPQQRHHQHQQQHTNQRPQHQLQQQTKNKSKYSNGIDDHYNQEEDETSIRPMDSVDIFGTKSQEISRQFAENVSGSSIDDYLGGITSLHEDDSDDLEEQTKAMLGRLDRMKLSEKHRGNDPSQKPLRKVQSTPAMSAMDSFRNDNNNNNGNNRDEYNDKKRDRLREKESETQSASNRLFTKNRPSLPIHQHNKNNDDFNVKIPKNKATTNSNNDTEETSPSSVSTANTDKDSIYSAQSSRATELSVLLFVCLFCIKI